MALREADQITLGELIAALAEEVLWSVHDEKEADKVAANIFTDLWRRAEPISKRWH